ncbi:hypothetical protein GPZ77_00340 [Streptomyces sp. QHH-9511]|nr:hypothetical protein GPZ77_00340 [Streptomyces sp. QHH-9511]
MPSRPCKAREQCTRSNNKSDMGRRITLRPQAEYEAIQQARAQEDTQEWKEQHAHRAGVEGTISQGVRAFGLPAGQRGHQHPDRPGARSPATGTSARRGDRSTAPWRPPPRAWPRARPCHRAGAR